MLIVNPRCQVSDFSNDETSLDYLNEEGDISPMISISTTRSSFTKMKPSMPVKVQNKI